MAASDSAIFSFSFSGFTSTKASWNIFFHSRLFPSKLKFSIETSYIQGRRPSKPTWNVVVLRADGTLLLRQSILSPNVKVSLVSQCFNRNSTARGRAMNGGTQIRQLDPNFGQRYFERSTRRRRPQLFQDALDELVMFATAAAIKIGYVHLAVPHGPLTMLRFLFVCHAILSSVSYYTDYYFIFQLYFKTALLSKHRLSRPRVNFAARGRCLQNSKTPGETVLKIRLSNVCLTKEEGEEFA